MPGRNQTSLSRSLGTYSGTWDIQTAGHFLRRTIFGPKRTEINSALLSGLSGTLDSLLETPAAVIDPPINYYYEDDPLTPIGQPWVNAEWSSGKDFVRRNCFRAWRISNLLNHPMTIHQKIALFWYNHFAVEASVVADARGIYELADLFYQDGLGSFKILVEKVTVTQAMLIYLNGNTNQASSPNENYARELFELFTVGKGPLISEGNYTNYTEHDIQEAAKVLSGFTTTKNPDKGVNYYSGRHNKETKQFSSIFNNHVITNQEDSEYLDLINMIFQNRETARHICRKLYRWFLYYEINDDVEQNIIESLAQTLIDNNFEVKPVLRQLLSSDHFFDSNIRGAHIKPPLDYIIGFQRQLEVEYSSPEDFNTSYKHWMESYYSTNKQLQSISDPPDVAGWKAYYQEPAYYRSWISSVTLIERNSFTERLLSTNGIKKNGIAIKVDAFNVFNQFENKSDPNEVVRQFAELLIPVDITEDEKAALKESLIPGLPDFEWTVEYGDYASDPNNAAKKGAIHSKLIALIRSIKNLPQFQLC